MYIMSLVSSEGESYCSVQGQARNDPKPEGKKNKPTRQFILRMNSYSAETTYSSEKLGKF